MSLIKAEVETTIASHCETCGSKFTVQMTNEPEVFDNLQVLTAHVQDAVKLLISEKQKCPRCKKKMRQVRFMPRA